MPSASPERTTLIHIPYLCLEEIDVSRAFTQYQRYLDHMDRAEAILDQIRIAESLADTDGIPSPVLAAMAQTHAELAGAAATATQALHLATGRIGVDTWSVVGA